MILAQSLFKLLKQRQPAVVIDVIAPGWTQPLLARMPEINRAIEMPLGHGKLGLTTRWRLGRQLRAEGYQQAIVLPRSWKSAVVPFAAGARRRSGYLGELRWGLLNDIRPLDKEKLPRTVDRFVALGLDAGEPQPTELPEPRLEIDQRQADAVRQRLGLATDGGQILALCPGAEYGPAKRWPARYFAEVANQCLEGGWQVWLFGSASDSAITGEIQAATTDRCIDLGGRTTLQEAIDLLAQTDAVISNDSGLMHIAAATDRPLVAIYGSSDPGHTPPMNRRSEIVSLGLECSPCFKRECPLGHLRCLRELTPAMVTAALERCIPRH